MLNFLMRWVFRILLCAAGLIFAASILVFLTVFAMLWGLRAVWARLTGQPITPWMPRMTPRDGWEKVFKTGQPGNANSAADNPSAARKRDTLKDVTDVDVK